ncbi:Uncharacterized protein OBRU01_26958, partial [Operophtera brumata]
MYRLLLVSYLALFGSVIALSDVNKECIAENSEAWSNDNLIGTWYKMWKFTLMGGMVPFVSCAEFNFTRPTADIVQEYKNKYNDPDLPYNIDNNPVLVNDGYAVEGLVFGHNIAKFYVLTPNTTSPLNWDGYAVYAYRQLAPKYIMYTECALRGHSRWLLTTD